MDMCRVFRENRQFTHHSSTSSAGVKNAWSCTFISPFNFMACIRKLFLPFHATYCCMFTALLYAIREYDKNKDINKFYLSSLD